MPGPALKIKDHQAVVHELRQELDREEGVAAGLLVQQIDERSCQRSIHAEGIANEFREVCRRQRRQRKSLEITPLGGDGRQGLRKGMQRIDLVIAIRADQEQIANFSCDNELPKQIERCLIDPLQVIEEKNERMVWTCEYGKKSRQDELEAVPGFLRW